jgi:hypothetical protein
VLQQQQQQQRLHRWLQRGKFSKNCDVSGQLQRSVALNSNVETAPAANDLNLT